MGHSVLLTSCLFQNTPGPHSSMLTRAGFEVTRLRGPLPESEMLSAVGFCDAILCDTDDITDKVLAKASPRLKLISKVGASIASIDAESCARRGISVINTSGINHHAVAELTMGLMLSLCRNIPMLSSSLRDGRWRREPGNELRGRQLGVIGLGRIGMEVAKLARCFGMEVDGYSNHWPMEFAQIHGIKQAESLEAIAAKSAILTLHAALTPENTGMVNRAFIENMPPGALLINTSRSGIVDHDAVFDALESGHLGGFASDVPEPDPPNPDDPLIRHPRAIFTPHIGSLTYQSIPRLLVKAAENLIGFFQPVKANTD